MLLMQKVVVCVSTEFILVHVPCNKMKKPPRSLRTTSIALTWKDRTGKQLEGYVFTTQRVILIQKIKNHYDKTIPRFFPIPKTNVSHQLDGN